MSEFGSGGDVTLSAEASAEADRERHESEIGAVLERLRAEGFFREGETTALVFPEPGTVGKWQVRCDSKAFMSAPPDPERKSKFPGDDPLKDALVAAGYAVSVHPDFTSSDDDFFCLEYRMSRKEA